MERSKGVKRLQSCWAEGETSWHIPHYELGPDQNGCVIKCTVMHLILLKHHSNPTECATQRAFITMWRPAYVHMHTSTNNRYVVRQGAEQELNNWPEQLHRTEREMAEVEARPSLLNVYFRAPGCNECMFLGSKRAWSVQRGREV